MGSVVRFALYLGMIVVLATCMNDPGAITTTSQSDAVSSAPAVTEATELSTTTTTTVIETTTTTVDLGYRWEVGDCLRFATSEDLPYEPYGSEQLTPCEERHTHEVYLTGTFPGGGNAAYPEDRINPEINEICIGAFAELLGALPVEVAFDLVMYLPDAEEWASGLRYQACVVFLPEGVNTFRELIGSSAGRGDEHLLEILPGLCLTAAHYKAPPVGCVESHMAELIGTVTHPAQPGAPYPGGDQLELFGVSECGTLGADYVVPSSTSPVAAFARPFSEPEWETGWRDLYCMAVALGPGGEFLTVTGSFAEAGWEVVPGDDQT